MNRTVLFLVLFALSSAFAQNGAIAPPLIPTLEPKGEYEKQAEFEIRKVKWENQLITETRPNALITLGNYDAEKEVFEIDVQDTANAKAPFHFAGEVNIPLDTAKVMNRSTVGFLASVSYLYYPFVFGDSSFSLAMKEFALFRNEVPLKVDGVFKPIDRFEAMEGYNAWRSHADSILSAPPKTQEAAASIVPTIVIADTNNTVSTTIVEAPIRAEATSTASTAGGGGLGWRGWTRILTFAGAAACGTMAVVKHLKMKDYEKDISNLNSKPPSDGYGEYKNNYNSINDNLEESKKHRNIFGIGTGVFVVAGTFTFFF